MSGSSFQSLSSIAASMFISISSVSSHSREVGGTCRCTVPMALRHAFPALLNASSVLSCRLYGAYLRSSRLPLISATASRVPAASKSLTIVPTNSGNPRCAQSAVSSDIFNRVPNANNWSAGCRMVPFPNLFNTFQLL